MNRASGLPPRLGVVLPTLSGGGLERVMALLGAEWAAAGAEVEFLLCGRPDEQVQAPAGTRLHWLERRGAGHARRAVACGFGLPALWPGALSGQISALAALERWLQRERPQVLVAAGTTPNLLALAARARACPQTRVVVTVHNTVSRQFSDPRGHGMAKHLAKRWGLPRLLRRGYAQADAVVAVSAGVADDLAQHIGFPRSEITCIHNPVVDDEFLAELGAPCPHPWLIPGQPPVVLSVGRLVPRKRLDLLLRAHRALVPELGQRLMIVGTGPERARLERLAQDLGVGDSVHWTGRVPSVAAYYEHAAAFAFCSRYEGFGLVLAEALAAGCPVVSTDCPHGPAEVLDRGCYGRLVPVDDLPALVEALRATLASAPDRALLRTRGRAFHSRVAAAHYLECMQVFPELAGAFPAPVPAPSPRLALS